MMDLAASAGVAIKVYRNLLSTAQKNGKQVQIEVDSGGKVTEK